MKQTNAPSEQGFMNLVSYKDLTGELRKAFSLSHDYSLTKISATMGIEDKESTEPVREGHFKFKPLHSVEFDMKNTPYSEAEDARQIFHGFIVMNNLEYVKGVVIVEMDFETPEGKFKGLTCPINAFYTTIGMIAEQIVEKKLDNLIRLLDDMIKGGEE